VKKYYTMRFSDKGLFKKAKKRAIDEGISLLELLHKAVADYLKKPIDKGCVK
jgi:hypothetical protein